MPRHVFYEPGGARVARDDGGSVSAAEARPRPPVERLLDGAAYFLLPAWCLGCAARLPWRPSPLGLCAVCSAALPRPRQTFDGLVAAWSYEPPIDEVIRRLKYGRLEFLADDLGDGIAAAIGTAAERYDWVTAVPLHWRRRLARGYDQAALLAAAVAGRLRLPYRAFLIRARSTPPQVSRSAASRRDNVAGAFRCRRRGVAALDGAAVLLIDDVATTGATLRAARAALESAGATRVTAAVAAWTPPGRG